MLREVTYPSHPVNDRCGFHNYSLSLSWKDIGWPHLKSPRGWDRDVLWGSVLHRKKGKVQGAVHGWGGGR